MAIERHPGPRNRFRFLIPLGLPLELATVDAQAPDQLLEAQTHNPFALEVMTSAGLPSLKAVAPVDPAAVAEAAARQSDVRLGGRGTAPVGDFDPKVWLDQIRSADGPTRDAALAGLNQGLENMWWQNDPRLGAVLAALFAGLTPEEVTALMGRLSAPAHNAFEQAHHGGRLPRAGRRAPYFDGSHKSGAVPRSNKTIADTKVPAEKSYPPHSDKAKALFREAAKLAGVPEKWADSPALHNILQRESNGVVGRPNYTYGGRAKDPSAWASIHAELKGGRKSTVSSATGLGQLILPNVDRYYPAGRKGIGDPLQEAAGMMAYIKDRYGSPENAWARYGRGHEGY